VAKILSGRGVPGAHLIALSLLCGCAGLPTLEGRVASSVISDTSDTRLGKAAQRAPNPDESGIYPLQDSLDAFAARALLARRAERSLDIQYYIWHGDTTGYLMIGELWDAAERGVRVRLLLDDNGIRGLDPALAALDGHPNVEVRVFNPFKHRRFRAIDYVTDLRRINRRMHNKSFTADTQATIVGGRNIGDEYFGAGEQLDFADFDVLAIGPIVREVGEAFDLYGNSESAYPAASLMRPAGPEGLAAMQARIAATRGSAEGTRYVAALRKTQFIEALLARSLRWDWARTRVVYDDPAKALDRSKDPKLLLERLKDEIGEPRHELDLVSSYFVPRKDGTAMVCAYAASGVHVRIFTNSLATTDVGIVHAGYAKRRKPLLRCGARIYELKPDATPAEINGSAEHEQRRFAGISNPSLHAKTFAVDRSRVFVGSLNLDPRSVHLNTEMGLVVESVPLAEGVVGTLDRAAMQAAYEVALAPGGHGLEWTEHTEEGETLHYRTEPKSGFFRRVFVKMMSWLPIEPLL
jgi:putative cardiolipin synthase